MGNQDQLLFQRDGGPGSDGPVECLGLAFDSDDERRAYFIELLREKLRDPEFRAIEGFPIGEDEAILALSDPPYYTACPNPWLVDFVTHYGASYDPEQDDYAREPFAADVSEGKADAVYNAHSYHTKVPYRAIMHYILHFTQPGDVVFDGFGGTGMTGVAAKLCGHKATVESLGYRVANDGVVSRPSGEVVSRVGSRCAVISDLSPIATFIAHNYNTPIDVAAFEAESANILDALQEDYGWMYETRDKSGSSSRIDYTVWSEVLACPECGDEMAFLAVAYDPESRRIRETFPCPRCGTTLRKALLTLLYDTRVDPAIGTTVREPRRVPVLVFYRLGRTKVERAPNEGDLETLRRVAHNYPPSSIPVVPLPEMQMAKVGRMQPARIEYLHQFFLPRAGIALGQLWRATGNEQRPRIRQGLRFFVEQAIWTSSVLNRYRPSGYSQVNQFLAGVFYVPSQMSEPSPWYVLDGKRKRLVPVLELLSSVASPCAVSTGDCGSTGIPGDSVDYVFTDPPFGENIYYSDLNFLLESWHGVWTNNIPEAIVDKVHRKTLSDYQRLMQRCFAEYHRVLKPGRWMTIEFHNSQNAVWTAIQEALERAGMVVADVRVLDKKQGSFQQVVSAGAVKQDLVISAYKPRAEIERVFAIEAGTAAGAWSFLRGHLMQLPIVVEKEDTLEIVAERQAHLLYDRMVAFHVQRGVQVPLSASDFYAGLDQRFPCRDSMYFLSEQATQYDKKRLQAQEVMQLELFVTDEDSAIQWLRRLLSDRPLSFQEIHPLFMREIAGWERHEKPLELAELLEENFIRYGGDVDVPSQIHAYLSSNFHELRGRDKSDSTLRAKAKDRWYVPDPRKAGDLEQLRERTLLKEFDDYAAGKGKLRVFRVEAVRAGFKRAWREHDYETIISVAERLPANVLQEDARLLMWYDQALTRAGE